jgi:DNA-directed RNA polymerase specialized sigma subunit
LNLQDKKRSEIEINISTIYEKIDKISSANDKMINNIETIKNNYNKLIIKRNQINENITDYNLPTDNKNLFINSIPIKKETALAPLTQTEFKILDLLYTYGEKTASQIKSEIKLSREHTSRLMKKLYLSGYIDRKTDKIPYIYYIKKEMVDILNNK